MPCSLILHGYPITLYTCWPMTYSCNGMIHRSAASQYNNHLHVLCVCSVNHQCLTLVSRAHQAAKGGELVSDSKALLQVLWVSTCPRYCGFPHVPVMSPPHMFPACMTKLLTGLLVCLSPFSEWQWGHCVSSYIAQTVPLCQGSWPESHHTKKGYAVLTNVMLCTCTSFLPTLKSGCFFLRIGLFDALSKTTWDCLACKWTMLQLGMGPISSIRDGQYSDFSSGQGKYHNYHNYCCNEIFKDVKP